jgi:hypothetical protein
MAPSDFRQRPFEPLQPDHHDEIGYDLDRSLSPPDAATLARSEKIVLRF